MSEGMLAAGRERLKRRGEMVMNRWWIGEPDEICWMETTDREQRGTDLNCPPSDEAGRNHSGYALVKEVMAGDVVFHYHVERSAIVNWSRVVGTFGQGDVVWPPTPGGGRRVYEGQGYLHPLDGPYELSDPVALEDLRVKEDLIRELREALAKANARRPIYFPFALSVGAAPRAIQYMTKLPVGLIEIFPQLREAFLSSR